MDKIKLNLLLDENIAKKDWWYNREIQAAWNDDGKGGHIDATKMIAKYQARIELLNELINLIK